MVLRLVALPKGAGSQAENSSWQASAPTMVYDTVLCTCCCFQPSFLSLSFFSPKQQCWKNRPFCLNSHFKIQLLAMGGAMASTLYCQEFFSPNYSFKIFFFSLDKALGLYWFYPLNFKTVFFQSKIIPLKLSIFNLCKMSWSWIFLSSSFFYPSYWLCQKKVGTLPRRCRRCYVTKLASTVSAVPPPGSKNDPFIFLNPKSLKGHFIAKNPVIVAVLEPSVCSIGHNGLYKNSSRLRNSNFTSYN